MDDRLLWTAESLITGTSLETAKPVLNPATLVFVRPRGFAHGPAEHRRWDQ